jgi:hypothetical protein
MLASTHHIQEIDNVVFVYKYPMLGIDFNSNPDGLKM